ncbi:4-(cytidine 5'-diphospho)-2-C-methyl-D-erythritol kinase [Jatrophihabitans sp.]|uniref:4-(cytidine 5'-diphospho)-2-C-methyl-D-erythritol kinase n=1 Tax=Jatrophihabitans sp. TaxID=1932789 RepID=UPI002C9851FA|nr:4-(cytidine 5'-diphospho)-2-C-methyl-D-erythritol kinase [Jatrophihabitans sp.]
MSQTAGRVIVRVPAKINLQLAVGPLRPDGFHELATVFCALDLCDVLTASPAGSLTLDVQGPEGAGLAADRNNLAWRAAELLAGHAGVPARVGLHIEKNIPVAAGLAGGSADAAAALLACDRLWGLHLPAPELAALAARLGSDVAFALLGGTAVGAGRGERLRPIEGAASFSWVLAAADGGLATPAVYAELDRQRGLGDDAPAPVVADPAATLAASGVAEAVTSGDPELLAGRLGNDLQPAALALAPYLADTLAAGQKCGALAGLVSGSGPTCAFLARDGEHARTLARALAGTGSCRQAFAVTGGTARPTVLG